VIPPVAISQTIPAAVLSGKRVWSGVVEVRIGDTGQVLSARMATPINAAYDKELLQAASSWRYRPALKDGVPVPYVKTINIQVDTRPECSPVIATQCRPPAK
jgi:TonB family protein